MTAAGSSGAAGSSMGFCALAAIAIWRSGVLPFYSGILFAVGFALFIPQFYAPPAVRIGHGALVATGSIWVAMVLRRAESAEVR